MFRKLFLLVLFATFMFSGVVSSNACVGKSLVIGSVSGANNAVVAEMLSILITERTGTTVVVKSYPDYKSLGEAMKKSEIDIMLDYTGRCYIDVLGKQPEADAVKVFSSVKEVYQRDMNLIWLEPFGFSDAAVLGGKGGKTPSIAAPVVRKDTLGKFPALPRVINKLSGKIDNGVISKLVSEGGNGNNKKATRKFLKDNRLI